MNESLKYLAKKLDEKGAKVVFGLEAQGHIPTIEAIITKWNDTPMDVQMQYSKALWDEVGKTIGWCSLTAALSYFQYLEHKNTEETKV